MRHLPNPPRTEGFSDPEAVIDAYRRWFWALADYDFDYVDPPRWTHDDNRQAQTYGFCIYVAPDKTGGLTYALVSLSRYVSEATIEAKLVKLAPLDPLCAKALAVLSAEKLRNGG